MRLGRGLSLTLPFMLLGGQPLVSPPVLADDGDGAGYHEFVLASSVDGAEIAKWTEVRLAMQDGGTVIG